MNKIKNKALALFSIVALVAFAFTTKAVTLPLVPANYDDSLASGISASATSLTLVNGTDRSGNSLSGFACFTIDEGSPSLEYVCGTASGTAVTGLTRGLDAQNPNATSTGSVHRRGANVKITDYPLSGFLKRILNGVDSLTSILKYDFSTSTGFSADNQIPNKKYIDDLAFGTSTFWLPSGNDLYNGNSGSIGIGTSAPSSTDNKLHVSGNIGVNGLINFGAIATTTTYSVFINEPALHSLAFNTAGSEALRIDSSQRVGIGTTTPSQTLEVVGRVKFSTGTSTETASADNFNLLPAGVIQMYATSTAPAGWLLADGTAYATSSYPRLFAVIGYTYGSSTGNFLVPDMRGRTAFGYKASDSLYGTMGATGGATSTLLASSSIPQMNVALSHSFYVNGDGGSSRTFTSSAIGNQITATVGEPAVSQTRVNTYDPYSVVNYIIKY